MQTPEIPSASAEATRRSVTELPREVGLTQLLPRLMDVGGAVAYNTYRGSTDFYTVQDIVQEVAEKTWQKLDPDHPNVEGWVRRVARNAKVDYLRTRSSRCEILTGDIEDEAELAWTSRRKSDAARPEEQSIDLEPLKTFILEVFMHTGEENLAKERLDMLLMASAGFSMAEIATQYNVPRGTVGSRLAYARERLRPYEDLMQKYVAGESVILALPSDQTTQSTPVVPTPKPELLTEPTQTSNHRPNLSLDERIAAMLPEIMRIGAKTADRVGKGTLDWHTKQDIAQETAIKAWLKLDPDHPKTKAWVGITAQRQTLDYLRHRARRPEYPTEMRGDDEGTNESTPIWSEAQSNQPLEEHFLDGYDTLMIFFKEILEAKNKDHAEQNMLIFRMFTEGYVDAEIAEVTGLPKGTVKSRLHYIRKTMAPYKDLIKAYVAGEDVTLEMLPKQ